jgi:hypothetical protein
MKAAQLAEFCAWRPAVESQTVVGVAAISGIIERTQQSFFDEADMNS